jgi:heme/copper-type cytochrome/quinol oxidase subunit 3
MSNASTTHSHAAPDVPMTAAALKAEALRVDNWKFATWLYLASEVVIFSIFIMAYAVFRAYEPEVVKRVHDSANILLVTLNTFLLLTSSWTMVMGLRQIQRDNVQGLVRWFTATAVLGTIFLILQYVEYQELGHLGIVMGITPGSSEWSTFGNHFYVPTFFHGLHVFVGVIWCIVLIRHALRGGYSAKRHVSIEIFGLYWHFVDVIWVLLFTLIYLV